MIPISSSKPYQRIIMPILIALSLAPAAASAFEYDFEITIRDEEDINDAYTLGLIEDEEIVNNLINLLNTGLDLNSARYNDLIQLPGITNSMATAIVEARRKHGKFKTVKDLEAIEEVPAEIWEQISPFLRNIDEDNIKEEIPVTADIRLGYIQYIPGSRDKKVEAIDSTSPGFYLSGKTGFRYKDYKFDFGALMTVRDLTKIDHFDNTYRILTTQDANRLGYVFDGAYALVEGPWLKAIGGSYNIGFGEKLTFDSTGKSLPNGIATPLHYYENNTNGKLTTEKSLLGLAATFDNLRLQKGWLTTSVWLSYKQEDLYQYDSWYGADQNGDLIACETNADCPKPGGFSTYTCGDDHYCHSSAIYISAPQEGAIPETPVSYLTMHRYYTERLFGAQFAYNYNDRTRIGILGYASQWLFSKDVPGAMFSLSASIPQRDHIFAFGAYGTFGAGPVDLGFETTIMDNKGFAALIRLEATPNKIVNLSWKMRFYNALYDNPYGRGQAAADELFGKRNRNEYGNHLVLNIRPTKFLRLTTDFDIWSHPYTEVPIYNGEIIQFADRPWITDMSLIQRFVFRPAARNTISLWASYKNKDLSTNGYSFINDQGETKGNAYASRAKVNGIYVEGRGEQVQAALQGQTNFYKPLSLSLALINCWEGVTKYTDKFDYTLKLWFMANYKPWKYTTIATTLKYWHHLTPPDIDPDSYYDRGEPQFNWYLVFTQQLPKGFSLKAHYGISKYIDDRINPVTGFYLRHNVYHTVKAYVEWNYEAMAATKSFAAMRRTAK